MAGIFVCDNYSYTSETIRKTQLLGKIQIAAVRAKRK